MKNKSGISDFEYILTLVATGVLALFGIGVANSLGCLFVSAVRLIISLVLGLISSYIYNQHLLTRFESWQNLPGWAFILGAFILLSIFKVPNFSLKSKK